MIPTACSQVTHNRRLADIMKHKLKISHEDGVVIALLGDEYDNLDVPGLEAAGNVLLELAQTAVPPQIVIDMQHTEFFGSAFLGILFRTWQRLSLRNGKMACCNARDVCGDVLNVTQVGKLWAVCPSRDAAIRAVKGE